MKNIFSVLFVIVFFITSSFAQSFKVKANGEQRFHFDDQHGGSQAAFFSKTPLEDITGLTNEVTGDVTFNITDIQTLKGKLSVPVSSIKTGIDMRDGHLQSANWLNADSYPDISFVINNVSDVKSVTDNKLNAKVAGDFIVHGVTKKVIADATLTYLDESELTKTYGSGDLLGVQAKFNIKLSDYGINNKLIGQKVAEDIEISVNIVGSNAN